MLLLQLFLRVFVYVLTHPEQRLELVSLLFLQRTEQPRRTTQVLHLWFLLQTSELRLLLLLLLTPTQTLYLIVQTFAAEGHAFDLHGPVLALDDPVALVASFGFFGEGLAEMAGIVAGTAVGSFFSGSAVNGVIALFAGHDERDDVLVVEGHVFVGSVIGEGGVDGVEAFLVEVGVVCE